MINKPLLHITFYLLGYLFLYIAHKVDPTNLAGPGLDMLIFIIFSILIAVLLIKTLIKNAITKSLKFKIVIVHIIGIAVLGWFLNQPT